MINTGSWGDLVFDTYQYPLSDDKGKGSFSLILLSFFDDPYSFPATNDVQVSLVLSAINHLYVAIHWYSITTRWCLYDPFLCLPDYFSRNRSTRDRCNFTESSITLLNPRPILSAIPVDVQRAQLQGELIPTSFCLRGRLFTPFMSDKNCLAFYLSSSGQDMDEQIYCRHLFTGIILPLECWPHLLSFGWTRTFSWRLPVPWHAAHCLWTESFVDFTSFESLLRHSSACMICMILTPLRFTWILQWHILGDLWYFQCHYQSLSQTSFSSY